MRGRLLGVLALALFLGAPATAHATFPGDNGKIAYVSGGDIWTMNADGSNQANLTNDAPTQGAPNWSPDGSKIAFDQSDPAGRKIWTMNADGTNRVLIDDSNIPYNKFNPGWSPDGTEIVYAGVLPNNNGGIATMNLLGGMTRTVDTGGQFFLPEWSPADGAVLYSLWNKFNCNPWLVVTHFGGPSRIPLNDNMNCTSQVTGGSWSPNAQRVLFYQALGALCPCPPAGAYTEKPDGTDTQLLPGPDPAFDPVYSPDGTKVAYSDGSSIRTRNLDGSGVSGPLAAGSLPDWQPVLRGYPRPKAATPMYAPLVPAYTPCASPNRVHAAPLSYNSCNPPTQTSGFATVGTPDSNGAAAKSVGSLKLVAIGEVPINTGNGNQSDVVIDFSITDVRNKTGLTDYSGGLRVKSALQITDRNNTPYPGGPGPGTVVPASFEFSVPCTTTPSDATVGSTCSTSTTANAVLPGQVLERQRAMWQLGRIEVADGGTDGNPNTAGDDTLFAAQGVFVP